MLTRIPQAIVLMMSVAATACSPPSDMAGLAGTYVMTIAYNTDTLRLDPSGRYTRRYVQGSSPVVPVDTGRWTVSRNGRLVQVRDLPRRWPEHGRYDPVQGWHAPDTTVRQTAALSIGTTWTGRTELGVRPEIGWRYRRLRLDR